MTTTAALIRGQQSFLSSPARLQVGLQPTGLLIAQLEQIQARLSFTEYHNILARHIMKLFSVFLLCNGLLIACTDAGTVRNVGGTITVTVNGQGLTRRSPAGGRLVEAAKGALLPPAPAGCAIQITNISGDFLVSPNSANPNAKANIVVSLFNTSALIARRSDWSVTGVLVTRQASIKGKSATVAFNQPLAASFLGPDNTIHLVLSLDNPAEQIIDAQAAVVIEFKYVDQTLALSAGAIQ